MVIHRDKSARGLTLVELMVATLAALIVILGASAILFHGHIGYGRLFRRVNSDVVRNAYEARRTFDRLVRKASMERIDPRDGDYRFLADENQLYVYYYLTPQSLVIDRYARFYLSGTELRLEQGTVTGGFQTPPPGLPNLSTTSDTLLANNVIAPDTGVFAAQGNALRMVLVIDDETGSTLPRIETLKMTITTTAIRHNQ